jgi:hypothetical protein
MARMIRHRTTLMHMRPTGSIHPDETDSPYRRGELWTILFVGA